MRAATLGLVFAVGLCAQTPDAKAALEAARARMVAMLAELPNYTCVEQVERGIRGIREDEFRVRDTVRLEVALVNGKEMFAWPGGTGFDDAGLRTFVPAGMFGDGYFGLYSKAVFGEKETQFQSRGASEVDGRAALRYDFRVGPQALMQIHSMDASATVGYSGSLYIDSRTYDVLRLEVAAEDMPVRLGLRQTTAAVKYGKVRIGDREVVLPVESEMLMTTWMGDTSRNLIHFSECREFSSESALRFGDAAAAGAAVSSKPEIRLPGGLPVELRLVDETDLGDMAIGDPVHAVLNADVQSGGRVLLPKGAPVHGHVVRMTVVANYIVLGFVFDEVEAESARASLSLTFQRATGPDLIGPNQRWQKGSPVAHEGMIGLRPGKRRLDRRIILYWRT